MTTHLDELAQLHVQTFNGIRCVHNPPNLRRKHEERYDVLPRALPRRLAQINRKKLVPNSASLLHSTSLLAALDVSHFIRLGSEMFA